MNFQNDVYQFIQRQLAAWPLAAANHAQLEQIHTKTLQLSPSVSVIIQCNPKRINSTAAKVDKQSIAQRRCFLCKNNLPPEELSLPCGNYHLHINPYPILPNHLVIAHNQHIPQDINSHLNELLSFAQQLPSFAVFFNGIGCGASAPDHLHFQAVERHRLPLLADISQLPLQTISTTDSCTLRTIPNYHRTVYQLQSPDITTIEEAFNQLITKLFTNSGKEIMINLLATYTDNHWQLYIFPRSQSRPWQFAAEGDQQLLVSPATIEMSGIIITPLLEHYQRITPADVLSIYKQVTL